MHDLVSLWWQEEIGFLGNGIQVALVLVAIVTALGLGGVWLNWRRVSNEEFVASLHRLAGERGSERLKFPPVAAGPMWLVFPHRGARNKVAKEYRRDPDTTYVVHIGKLHALAMSAIAVYIKIQTALATFRGEPMAEYLYALVSEKHTAWAIWRKVRVFVIMLEELKKFENEIEIERLEKVPGIVEDKAYLPRLRSLHELAKYVKKNPNVHSPESAVRVIELPAKLAA